MDHRQDNEVGMAMRSHGKKQQKQHIVENIHKDLRQWTVTVPQRLMGFNAWHTLEDRTF